jgi:hypothetical protein
MSVRRRVCRSIRVLIHALISVQPHIGGGFRIADILCLPRN